jgi:LacI family transcriptional regulator
LAVKDVTIKDIAKAADVSFATVSRALNHNPGVSEATREHIIQLAEEMGYRKNTIAASLASNKTKSLGLIVPELANPYFSSLMVAIKKKLSKLGYTLLICNSGWDPVLEEKLLRSLLERRVDGIFLYPCESENNGLYEHLRLPLLLFSDRETNKEKRAYVNVDHYRSGVMATRHLLDQGYKKPAFLGGNMTSTSTLMRLNGFQDVLKERGVAIPPDYASEGKYLIDSGHQRTHEILSKEDRPDAFFCANDLIALGCMAAVTEMGFTLGQDIGVIGVDNVAYSAFPQIDLSSIHIPIDEMGVLGVELLMEIINKKEDEAEEERETTGFALLEPELIIRATTCRSRKK